MFLHTSSTFFIRLRLHGCFPCTQAQPFRGQVNAASRLPIAAFVCVCYGVYALPSAAVRHALHSGVPCSVGVRTFIFRLATAAAPRVVVLFGTSVRPVALHFLISHRGSWSAFNTPLHHDCASADFGAGGAGNTCGRRTHTWRSAGYRASNSKDSFGLCRA